MVAITDPARSTRIPVQRRTQGEPPETADGALRDGGLRSVGAALDVLECFALEEELGVSDVARRLGVAKSTAHRLLSALCARGLTEKDPATRQYRLGMHLVELGQIAHSRLELRKAAFPMLEELREVSGCTVHLSIPDGVDVLQIERLESIRAIPLMAHVRRRWPLHATSSGKVIAAFDPGLAAARAAAGFPPCTERTIRSADEFGRALEQVRRTGYATNLSEAKDGAASVAAPVRDRSGRSRAAISLVGSTAEIARDLGRQAQLVTVAARKVAQCLGV
ncbi:IclR family transcriptional regulator [Streptomyces sp. NPDC000987]|uniref:IclR family transcriptional regulator n=1 Tax=Streptomyces sp. NPDC000987 TaxID=3154374 RepID=UPI0033188BC6